jgi:hypothetical protein
LAQKTRAIPPGRHKTAHQGTPSGEDTLEVHAAVIEPRLSAGGSPERYAQWLFGFLRTDLNVLTPGELLGMRADLWAFIRPERLGYPDWREEPLPSAEKLRDLQRDARAGLQRVLEGQWFELKHGIGYGIARMGGRLIKGVRRGTLEDLFRDAVMDAVLAFWPQLRTCARCREMFVKVGKQKYCSPACASRAHWERFKARRS